MKCKLKFACKENHLIQNCHKPPKWIIICIEEKSPSVWTWQTLQLTHSPYLHSTSNDIAFVVGSSLLFKQMTSLKLQPCWLWLVFRKYVLNFFFDTWNAFWRIWKFWKLPLFHQCSSYGLDTSVFVMCLLIVQALQANFMSLQALQYWVRIHNNPPPHNKAFDKQNFKFISLLGILQSGRY